LAYISPVTFVTGTFQFLSSIKNAQQTIKQAPELLEFYTHFQQRFISVSLAARVITSGHVSRTQDAFEKNVQLVGKVVDAVPIVNNIARVAQAGFILGAKMVTAGHGTNAGTFLSTVN
jgi:hypothetical protein